MRPVSVVRRPLFGRASKREIQGEEEAVAAGLQRQSRLLSPLRATLVLQRSESGNTLQISSPPPARPAVAAASSPSSPSSSLAAGEGEGGHTPQPQPELPEQQLLQKQEQQHHPLPDMPVKLGVRQRWVERGFLFSYILDFLVGPVYDRVLLPRPGGDKRPVLLVPGWCGRTRSFRRMADRLQQEGFPVYPVPLGSQLGCIDRKAGLVSAYLDRHGLEDVYVVAHSMGGLITVRSMMKGERRIRKLVTMGTPYRGTHVIYLGYAVTILLVLALGFYLSPLAGSIYLGLFFQIPSLWQMQPSSTFLQEVLAYLAKAETPVQCIYAIRDQIVVHNWRDAWSPTRLGRDDDLCLPEYGHMNLFMGPSGCELVARLLGRYEAQAAQAQAQAALEQEGGKKGAIEDSGTGSVAATGAGASPVKRAGAGAWRR